MIERHTLFQWEMIAKKQKYIDYFSKSSPLEPHSQFQPNLVQSIPGKGIQVFQMKGHAFFFLKSVLLLEPDGFVKVLADKETGKLLGCHFIGLVSVVHHCKLSNF